MRSQTWTCSRWKMNAFNQLVLFYNNNNNLGFNNLILNRNYQLNPSFVVPITRLGGFTSPYSCLVDENSVPRALISTPFVSLFGRDWSNSANSNVNGRNLISTSENLSKNEQRDVSVEDVEIVKPNWSEERDTKRVSEKAKRKQAKPTKCLSFEDPDFKGVTINMQVQIRQKFQSELISRHIYSGLCRMSTRRRRRRQRRRRLLTSSYDCACASYDKQCASCGTAKTPLWRDAEDGTPLCNACGIRYKKYRVRCNTCWRIPRKDRKSRVFCSCASAR